MEERCNMSSFNVRLHLHEMYMIRGSMDYRFNNDLTMLKEEASLLERSLSWFDKKCSANETVNTMRVGLDDLDEWIASLYFALETDSRLTTRNAVVLKDLAIWLDDVSSSEVPEQYIHISDMVLSLDAQNRKDPE